MSMIAAYAITGALIVLGMRIINRLSGRGAVVSTGSTPLEKLALLLVALLLIAFWPIALAMLLYDSVTDMSGTTDESASNASTSPFLVLPEDLGERLSLEAIEAREHVTDPLGAVPALPFGHLNSAWTAFTARLAPGDELWTFEASRSRQYGWLERRNGYVIVRAGQTVDHLLCGVRRIE